MWLEGIVIRPYFESERVVTEVKSVFGYLYEHNT